jgi:hypothetical protein
MGFQRNRAAERAQREALSLQREEAERAAEREGAARQRDQESRLEQRRQRRRGGELSSLANLNAFASASPIFRSLFQPTGWGQQ